MLADKSAVFEGQNNVAEDIHGDPRYPDGFAGGTGMAEAARRRASWETATWRNEIRRR
jgi:hypothetical protein